MDKQSIKTYVLKLGNMLRVFKMWLVLTVYGINVICSLVIIISRCSAQYWRPLVANKTKNLLSEQIKHIEIALHLDNCFVDGECYMHFLEKSLIKSPVLWTVDLMFYACFFFTFSPTHFFWRLQTDIFETFPHDVALLEKEALLCRFPKSALNKNEGRKPPNFAQFRV